MIMNKLIHALFLILLCTACIQKKQYTSPPGYDMNKPQKFIMPQSLEEVSGITFYHGNPDTLYAEQDEEGVLFRLKPGDTRAIRCRFANNGDYEDLAICHDRVIMLKSNGNLYVFPFSEASLEKAENVTEYKDLLPEGEFEGMYADEQQQLLYVLCKQGCSNKKDKTSKGFILQVLPDGSLAQKGAFTIDVKEIESRVNEKFNFHPAALAFNPRTAEWFIVSSVNKLLVITDPSWKVKQVYKLNPALYIQSEGMVFDNQGNLYISNEGNELSRGNILKIPYTAK
jgi:uncharacterized protein YjiK